MREATSTLFLLALLFSRPATGQSAPSAPWFKGKISDSATHQAIARSSLSLSGGNPAIRKNTVSDDGGLFGFSGIRPGSYVLTVNAAGYETLTRRFDLNAPDTSVALKLVPRVNTLQGVTVKGTQLLVQNKIDRLVYNVDRDITSQGGVATDILRKIPQVSVDINGNVELLGNPSVRFLINGKSSTIFGNSVAEALQSIPVSQIQSIEVMSSPGAKYDATGTGGIINIVLKKNKAQGFSGTVNATAGTRLENGSVNLNYKQNNISLNGYFSGSAQLPVRTLSESSRNATDTATGNQYLLEQNGSSTFSRNSYRAGAGLDWAITPRDNISFSVSDNHFGSLNEGSSNQHNAERTSLGNKISDEHSLRVFNTDLANEAVDASLDYHKTFSREKEELAIAFNYSAGRNKTAYAQSQRYGNDSIFNGSMSTNPGRDRLATASIDYAFPLGKKLLVETGVKAEFETLISDATVYSFNPALYTYVQDARQSYGSTFKRKVLAGYLSGTFRLLNYFDVLTGIRWEYTFNKAVYSNVKSTPIPDYSNPGPSLTISRSLDPRQTLRLSYAYRLERPEFRDLNPFLNLSDPHNIITGNPAIQPEIGHDLQLGYNHNFTGDNNLNLVLVYTYNSPDIKSFTVFYPSLSVGDSTYTNVNVTRRSNIASENRWGMVLSGAVTIAKKFTMRPAVQLYDRQTNNIYSSPRRITGFEYRLSLNATFQFSPSLAAEAFGNYRSGIRWQGTQAAVSSYTLALRKQLFGNKASLGLVAVNAFSKYFTQKTVLQTVTSSGTTLLYIPYRSFGLNFLYKFGKIKITKPKEAEDFSTKPPVEN